MLDKETYLKGIKYLNAYYTNFNFNINDDLKLEVWYKVLSSFDNTAYIDLVKSYSVSNIYAPQSPTHLFDYAKSVEIAKHMTADSAWDYAISLLRQLNYDFSRFYIECGYGIISGVIKSLKSELQGVHTENLPFIKKTFVVLYTNELKKSVDERLVKSLQLNTTNLLPQ